jgi:antitoxin component YwqK of YwqJK toxin-antitoxin module
MSKENEWFEYYPNGMIKNVCYYKNGKLHRNGDLPAKISFSEDGNRNSEEWYRLGQLHRNKGPARIGYHDNGEIYYLEFLTNGKYNRENTDLPSMIEYTEENELKYEAWFNYGVLINEKFYR